MHEHPRPRFLSVFGLMLSLLLVTGHGALSDPLSIGFLSASADETGITLTLSSDLAGGSGADFSYKIFRDTQPAVSVSGGPLATTTTFPFEDTTADSRVLYFYKVVGSDSASNSAFAVPAGLGSAIGVSGLAVAIAKPTSAVHIVYMGDSITAGATLSDPKTQAPPVIASSDLASSCGGLAVYFSNQGHGGHTFTDFLPDKGSDFPSAELAGKNLLSQHPSGLLIYSIMLGTNDSASTRTNGNMQTPDEVYENARSIVERLLTDFPSAIVVINDPPFYTPNTHNGATYEEAGLARLISYLPVYEKLVDNESKRYKGRIFVGDRQATAFFASHYLTEQTPENGQDGTFYLHPNVTGAADLGRLWANALAKIISQVPLSAR